MSKAQRTIINCSKPCDCGIWLDIYSYDDDLTSPINGCALIVLNKDDKDLGSVLLNLQDRKKLSDLLTVRLTET